MREGRLLGFIVVVTICFILGMSNVTDAPCITTIQPLVESTDFHLPSAVSEMTYYLDTEQNSRSLWVNEAGDIVGYHFDDLNKPVPYLWKDGSVTNLGTFNDFTTSIEGFNDAGNVLVTAYEDNWVPRHSFLWTADEGYIDLGNFGLPYTAANGINNLNQVVGSSRNPSGETRAFLWTADEGMLDLGTLGGSYSSADGINDNGQICGRSKTDEGTYHAFLWTAEDGMIDLGHLGGGYSHPMSWNGINEAGHVIGDSRTADGKYHAFLWTPEDGMIDLGTPEDESSYAHSFNDFDQVVVNAQRPGSDSSTTLETYSFLWTPEDGMIELDTLGSGYSYGLWINNAGQIVGRSVVADADDLEYHAVLWTTEGDMIELGIDGYNSTASGINDSGLIAGTIYGTEYPQGDAVFWKIDPGLDSGHSVIEVIDESGEPDGFAIGGTSINRYYDDSDFLLIRTDSEGNELWRRTYDTGYRSEDFASDIVQCSNGGFALVGSSINPDTHTSDVWFVLTDSFGDRVENSNQLPIHRKGGRIDSAKAIIELDDGGFAIAVATESTISNDRDCWLLITDHMGFEDETRSIQFETSDSWEVVNDIIACPDGGFALAGHTYTSLLFPADSELWLLRVHEDGSWWDESYDGGELRDYGLSLDMSDDGGFILGGTTLNSEDGSRDVWVVKTNAMGEYQWDEKFGGDGYEDGTTVVNCQDGTIAVSATEHNPDTDSYFFWLLRLTNLGDVISSETFDRGACQSLTQTHDEGFALVGNTIMTDGGREVLLLLVHHPPLAIAGGPYYADEGAVVTLDGSSSSDPDNDELQYRWYIDGSWTEWSLSPVTTHTWYDDYSGTVTLEVTDGMSTDSMDAEVYINNVVPEAYIDSILQPTPDFILPGDVLTFSGSYFDPGLLDTHELQWDFGDGESGQGTSVDHSYSTPGIYTVTFTVSDDDGGVGQTTLEVIVTDAPIYIDEDEDFRRLNFPGNGLEDDPFRIENYVFISSSEMIHIQDTTKWFVITGCQFNGLDRAHKGITLLNVINGNVSFNTIENCYSGIYVEWSTGVTVEDNLCNDNWFGIFLRNSHGNDVLRNTCNDNDHRGVWILSSNGNEIRENTCNQNGFAGIDIGDSTGNVATDNTCDGNGHAGIFLYNSHDSDITWNTCNVNEVGIYLIESSQNDVVNNECNINLYTGISTLRAHDNLISDNFCIDNGGHGIYLESSGPNNVVIGNTCNENDLYGIYLWDSHENDIIWNTCEDNDDAGIFLESSNSNTVNDNECEGNDEGIAIGESSQNEIYRNTCSHNRICGIILVNSHANEVFANTCYLNGDDGIFLLSSNSNVLTGNWCNENHFGFSILDSDENDVIANTCNDNLYVGIRLDDGSDNNEIRSNTCNSNGEFGIILNLSNVNTLIENTCNENVIFGIYLDNSHDNVIFNNDCNGNNDHGISLDASTGNLVTGNTCDGNGWFGIYLRDSHSNTISDNTCTGNLVGIYLNSSTDNDVTENTCNANSHTGIYLYLSEYNTIARNVCNDNVRRGITLNTANHNELSGNTCDYNAEYGILVLESDFITIDGASEYLLGSPGALSGITIENSRYVSVENYVISEWTTGITVQGGSSVFNTIYVNYITDNDVGIALIDARDTTVQNNIITGNALGMNIDARMNWIYLNLFINNDQQLIESGFNIWQHPDVENYELGNFWSNYWGEDDGSNGRIAGDYVGDTDLPHEDVDWYPLLDPSIPEAFGPLLYTDWWLIWRGGWCPVEIQAIDPLGRVVNSTTNEIGLNAFYVEDDQWDPEHTMVMIMIGIDPATAHFSSYTFLMTALDNITYSMEWFVSGGGEVLFERSVDNAPLYEGQTRVIETDLELNPDGSLTITPVAQYTFDGVLRPIKMDGTSIFEQGSTIPVKFILVDENGVVCTAHAELEIALVIDGVIGEYMPANSTAESDIDNVFRFDEEEGQYIFNLNTAELEVGVYILRITLDDGQQFTVQIEIA